MGSGTNDGPVTTLLNEWSRGNRVALEQLTPLVYEELHPIAESDMRRERPGHALHSDERPAELCALDEALEALAAVDPRKARAVEYHYFGGMSHKKIATGLEVHENTVARDLRLAEAWVGRHLRSDGDRR